jgi:putative endonuclease
MSAGGRDWTVYLIETMNGRIYTGITKDPKRRFSEHAGSAKGAKFFRTSAPRAILFQMNGFTRSEALRIEYRLKSLKRSAKLSIIENQDRRKLRSWLREEESKT